MNTEEIISSGLLESYALGSTSHEETLQVEWWIRTYPEVAAELTAIEVALESFAMANAVSPTGALKHKILAALNEPGAQSLSSSPITNTASVPVRKMYSPWKLVAAASVILLIGSSVFSFVYYNKYQNATDAYNNANEALAAKEQQLKDIDKDISVVQNKYSVPVSLDGLQVAPDAAAKIFWMKNSGDVYIDPSNLPDAPSGMQYQLWGIVDGKPVDGGMILTTKSGNNYHMQKMKNFGHAEAFAVTLETAGGNPVPKGDMYVMGKL